MLETLNNERIELKVTLSYFTEPNPGPSTEKPSSLASHSAETSG